MELSMLIDSCFVKNNLPESTSGTDFNQHSTSFPGYIVVPVEENSIADSTVEL